ncbi:MAG: SGNH/GDSL hydrolase family protein [Candidatus Cryptobacteroides sp.]
MKKSIIIAVLLALPVLVDAAQRIKADDVRVVIEGVCNIEYRDSVAILNRHSDALWNNTPDVLIAKKKARTQSGITIIFRTDSRTVVPLFADNPDGEHRGATNWYGIYKNGVFVENRTAGNLTLQGDGSMTEWTIVLPILYSVDYSGLIIEDGAKMETVSRPSRPVYFAIGDSITHGAGQSKSGSQITYPYVIAQENGYLLYNLAVGGSQISPSVADELVGRHVDIITIMWGFNDWNATRGDLKEITSRYTKLLENIVKVQPNAEIFCILPSTALYEYGAKPNKDGSPAKGKEYSASLPQVREAERAVAESFKGKCKIHILEGYKYTTTDDLFGNVHFNNDGAIKFGKAAAADIKSALGK